MTSRAFEDTFDFGLAPGEQFDPNDDAEEKFDPSRPHIMTALGPLDPDDLGITVWLQSAPSATKAWYADPSATLSALEAAFQRGLRSLAIPMPLPDAETHQDARWIASRSPVHLILAATPDMDKDGTEADVHYGLIAFNRTTSVRLQTDKTLAWRLPRAALASDLTQGQIDTLSASDRLIVVADGASWPSSSVVRQLAGTYIVLPSHAIDRRHAAAKVMFAIDGPPEGWSDQIERGPIELMEAGYSAFDVRRVLIDHPAVALTVAPTGA